VPAAGRSILLCCTLGASALAHSQQHLSRVTDSSQLVSVFWGNILLVAGVLMLAFLAARGVPVVVLAAAAAADALAAAAGGSFAPALAARFGGALLAEQLVFPAALIASSGARSSGSSSQDTAIPSGLHSECANPPQLLNNPCICRPHITR
jgi:hypothetical protein